MTPYVLVHGGWSGAHGFRWVRRELQAAGHEVFTPSLTGIGERVHLASPQVTLSTHIRDVVNHVLYEDLAAVVLVGFSYGGFVVTGALEHIADRVRHLVYLDAFVPDDGDTALGLTMGIDRIPVQLGEEWLVPAPEREFDDPAERDLGHRSTNTTSHRLLHRASSPPSTTRTLPLHPHLHQGNARSADGYRGLGARTCRGPGQALTGVAILRDRDHTHGPEQPTEGTGGHPSRTRVTTRSY